LAADRPLAQAQDADANVDQVLKDYLHEHFRQQPLEATQLGDHRFDHLLDDVTPKARERWEAHARQTLQELPQKVDYARLSRAGQIDFDIFKQELTRTLWLAEHTRPFDEAPRTYNSYINDSVYLLLAQSTLPKETNVANCIARIDQIPNIIAEAQANVRQPPR